LGSKEFGEVYLESGQRQRLLQVVNEQERLSEVRLTNGLQQITSDRTAKVYFSKATNTPLRWTGALSQALSALGKKNYTTEPLNPTQQPAIPKDATVGGSWSERALFDQEESIE